MMTWLLQAAFYAAIAGGVVAINRSRPMTRLVGAALLGFTLLSSATFFLRMTFELKLLREIVLVTWIAGVMFWAWMHDDGRRCYRWGLALCLLDVALCAAMFLHDTEAAHVRAIFHVAVNIIFVGLCACAAAPGVRDAYRAWIASIDRERCDDRSPADMDWAIKALDRTNNK